MNVTTEEQVQSLEEASAAMAAAVRHTVRKHRLWYGLQGVLMVLAGLVAIFYPLASSVAVTVFLGWLLILVGVFQAIGLVGAGRVPHFWLQLVSVLLCILIGFLFVRNPAIGVSTLSLLMIIFFAAEGMAKVVFSLTIRPLPKWGWVLLSGILGLILSAFLLASPVTAIWVLGLLIGIQLAGEGAALAAMAWLSGTD